MLFNNGLFVFFIFGMPLNIIRRVLPRRTLRDQYSFELLRSNSAQEMTSSSSSPYTSDLHKCYSNYDHVSLQTPQSPSPPKITEEAVDSNCSVAKTMPETLALIGFVAVDNPKCSYGFPAEDLVYEKAIAECCVIKESGSLNGGILLKCVDKQPLFPYLHFSQFQTTSNDEKLHEIEDVINSCQIHAGSLFGPYEEIYSIQKTSTASIDPRLPLNRHAGYIVIGFKLLDDSSKQQTLEKSWLSWSGAREIYKYSPRTWNLRRISLQKYKPMGRISSQLFAYILMCEFGSILHPSNTIQALDMCERLRVRNCGHIALYQVHTTYCSTTSNAKKMPTSSSATMKRQTMMRGFSQDVEAIPPECTADRRNRLRQSRDHSFQHPCSNFNSYQY